MTVRNFETHEYSRLAFFLARSLSFSLSVGTNFEYSRLRMRVQICCGFQLANQPANKLQPNEYKTK